MVSRMPVARLSLDRVNALTDGIVAIIITILVLGIEVPEGHDFDKQGLASFLAQMRHDVLIYTVSFWLIGSYWMQQRGILQFTRYGSRMMIWINLLHLFILSLLPFVTALKTAYPNEPRVLMLLGVTHMGCGLSLLALWRYCANRPELLYHPVSLAVRRSLSLRILIGPAISLTAVACGFFQAEMGTWIFLLTPLCYLSHRSVDGGWQPDDTQPRSAD